MVELLPIPKSVKVYQANERSIMAQVAMHKAKVT